MHSLLEEKICHCPYCGETITLLIDFSADVQNYIEDCEVCCRPITVKISRGIDNNQIELLQENDVA